MSNTSYQEGWVIEKRFHKEECYYYYIATKGRNIIMSRDGVTFSGLVDNEWTDIKLEVSEEIKQSI